MYFNYTTPESAGISSKNVLKLLRVFERYGFRTHSVIMARENKIFLEAYYKPFNRDFKHRMYSVSKSFVAIAMGFAIEEGLVSLDDKMTDYFKEYHNDKTNDILCDATIRDFLTMQTAQSDSVNWFNKGSSDRADVYFWRTGDKIPGTLWRYDSPGSYMLGAIVEQVTGMPFLEYLKKKCLNDIGFSKDAYCLMAPGKYSFGDSGVMCTSLDLLHFARFVMNGGTWQGKEYMRTDYIKDAVKPLVANVNNTNRTYNAYGYGYQIWGAPEGGFAFIGMGDQFAICHPDTDFIFIINSDNQGYAVSRELMYYELYNSIIHEFKDFLPEDDEAYKELTSYVSGLELFSLEDKGDNDFAKIVSGRTYYLNENPMNIEYVRLDFEGKRGTLSYKNLQGEKQLTFGLGYNEFTKFPEEGYSDMVATEFKSGHYYDAAVSADWLEEKKLRIFTQIIDKYFGNTTFILSFKNNSVTIEMTKTAENFLNEYQGQAIGFAKE